MTNAPSNLLSVRRLLLTHLDIHENSAAYPTDLDPAEVGIVGDAAHRGGYHCGSDRVDADDYSVDESPRDRAGLTLDAAALDVGQFAVRVAGKAHDLPSFSVWLVAQCKAGRPDTLDIREVIYSPDGVVVRRWDRLGQRLTGDGSHRGHTHLSFFRDAIKAGRDLTPLFRRYLTYIGLIQAPTPEDDVDTKQDALLYNASSITASIARMQDAAPIKNDDGKAGTPVKLEIVEGVKGLQADVDALVGKVAYLGAAVEQLAARPPAVIDYDQLADAIVRRVVAGPPVS